MNQNTMTFNRIGDLSPEHRHKGYMLESVLAVLVKDGDYDDAMTVLCAAMAHVLYNAAKPDDWHYEIKEVARILKNMLKDFPRHESGIEH
jgi:hypothetical protein